MRNWTSGDLVQKEQPGAWCSKDNNNCRLQEKTANITHLLSLEHQLPFEHFGRRLWSQHHNKSFLPSAAVLSSNAIYAPLSLNYHTFILLLNLILAYSCQTLLRTLQYSVIYFTNITMFRCSICGLIALNFKFKLLLD